MTKEQYEHDLKKIIELEAEIEDASLQICKLEDMIDEYEEEHTVKV